MRKSRLTGERLTGIIRAVARKRGAEAAKCPRVSQTDGLLPPGGHSNFELLVIPLRLPVALAPDFTPTAS